MSKTKKQELNSRSINLSGIRHFFERYGSLLYLVVIAAALATALLIVLQLINTHDTPTETGNALTSFDQETINLLRQDESTSQRTNVQLPSGRINPFE